MSILSEFLQSKHGDLFTVLTAPIEREEKRGSTYVPKTEEEFYAVINSAPNEILEDMGFQVWSTMNDLIKENNERELHEELEIPVLSLADIYSLPLKEDNSLDLTGLDENSLVAIPLEDLTALLNKKLPKVEQEENSAPQVLTVDKSQRITTPKELLPEDELVYFFPGEWFDCIPEGFEVTGLYGETYAFKKSEEDSVTRFGCLSFGIRRKIQSTEK